MPEPMTVGPLYRQAGFELFGTQRRAIEVAGRYHDKDHMVLIL